MKESGENYIEAIWILRRQKGAVRSVDVARMLGFARPSVSRAMKLLREKGFITMDDKGYIEFTQSGEEKAKGVYERHSLLVRILRRVGVSKETAENDACRIEHAISQETFEKLKDKFGDI